MINFFSSSHKKCSIKGSSYIRNCVIQKYMFSSKQIPMIYVKRLDEIKQMVRYIENIYSDCKNEKSDLFVKYFGSYKVAAFLHSDNNFEKIYNEWNTYHFYPKQNIKAEKKTTNEVGMRTNFSNNYEYLNSVFKLCSDEDGNKNIMKKNIIGIYIPAHRSTHSVDVNYFYIFKSLKDVMKGKFFYELYFILPNCVFLFSFIEIFKELIYYEKVVECIKKEKEETKIQKKQKNKKKDVSILRKKTKNNLLIKIYRYKKNALKKELKGELEKIFFHKKYTKIMYEDSFELSSFLYHFLKINSINFIDLHHLYQYIIALYELKILKLNIYTSIPILFPSIYNSTLDYACMEVPNSEHKFKEEKESLYLCTDGKRIDLCSKESRTNLCKDEMHIDLCSHMKQIDLLEKDNECTSSEKRTLQNDDLSEKNLFKSKKRKIISVYNSSDDSNNEVLNFEKQLIHILYIFPCAHKLLIKYKDLEGYNICYKMNEIIKKYNSLNIFKYNHSNKKSARKCFNNYTQKREVVEYSNFNENMYNNVSSSFINSLCSKVNINEEIIYNHQLIIGKKIYAYIYERNKCAKNIVFRFNLNSKNITFRNILSFKDSLTHNEINKKKHKYKYLLKEINNNLFSNNSKVLFNRNKKIYNYKNNILVGLLYDKETNFHYFDDKNIGDVVLCTICDISQCGKYLYLQRFDTKNLIFHFRKEKYINIEKNYDYDDITKVDEDILKEIA
ncbi:hypothetical protein MKS88_000415 [Plasmodium brasilianum]|uniref:Uncharacterized protein n=1 Tax=Plasmodium brasilianum TaxID=5824 RepID=A0ACB9YF47_PLABR|nr:hypothetical protein MKS88_000415 [Plasmodium brasilianum]